MARDTLHFHTVRDMNNINLMEAVRKKYIELDEYLTSVLPQSRSASICFTHLEDSLMRAIQSIALLGEKKEI